MGNVTPLTKADLPAFEMVFEGTVKALGVVPNSMLTMGHKPGILGTFSLLSGAIFHRLKQPMSLKTLRFFRTTMKAARGSDPDNEISPQLQQMIAYVCSAAAGCRYCQAHTAGSAHLLKVPDEKIAALLDYADSPLFDDAERAALDLAFAAGQVPNRSSKAHFDALKKHFNDAQIVEIVATIALFGFLNRWNDTMGTTLEAEPRQYAEKVLAAATGWEVGKHAAV